MASGDSDPSWTGRSRAASPAGGTPASQPVSRQGPAVVIVAGSPVAARSIQQVTFDRHELNRILGLYGRMVAIGEWRDYAIDFLKDRAVFSVFRHSSEVAIRN